MLVLVKSGNFDHADMHCVEFASISGMCSEFASISGILAR